MKKFFTYIHFVLLVLLAGLSSVEVAAQQTFPVVARFTQRPPYPVYLADFSNPAQTNLSIQVRQNDRTIASRPFRIRIYIEGQGFLIQSTDIVQGEPPLTLAFGQIYDLPATQVANYFKQYNLKVTPDQYRRPFNEGSFRFGVEIIDFQTNRPLSGIQWSNPVWITVNEPPVWVMPQLSQTLLQPTTPQNITFQWAPRHTNVNDVEYEFTLTEIITNPGFQGNIQNLFLAQPSFYRTRTRGLTLNYNVTLPPLIPGRTYAYRVQAIAKRGLEDVGVFRNNGFSEIQHFAYGEPIPDVKPPTNLRITRNESGNGANFEWKGEPEHRNFMVEYREKGSEDKWTTANVKPAAGNVYNSYNIPNLDEKKSYELRVIGFNEGNISATSAPILLADVTDQDKKEPKIAIEGAVQWVYFASEESVKDTTKLIQGASGTPPQREIKHDAFVQQKGSRKYPLENAIVTLFSSEEGDITAQNFKEKAGTIKRIETVGSDASGKFTFKATNIKLLADIKNLYVLVSYKGEAFNQEITKITIPATLTETKVLDPIIVVANSLRFSPRLLVEQTAVSTSKVVKVPKFIPWRVIEQEVRVPITEMQPIQGTLAPDNIEEIELYRLQRTITKNPYLKYEGNIDGGRTALIFNNDTYIKVADFQNTATSAQLFYNKDYNDSFVLRVKQKGRDEVIYPISGIEAFQEGRYAMVTDYFAYTPPSFKLKGYVERRGRSKTERVANAAVTAFGTTVRTNDKGYFEAEIPRTLAKDSKIALTAVDPLNTSNRVSDTLTYTFGHISHTLVLKEGAHYVSSVVYDGYSKQPLGGVMVSYKGSTQKTDSTGRFYFIADGDRMNDQLKLLTPGYTERNVSAKDFNSVEVKGSTPADNRAEWLQSLLPNNQLKTTLGRNAPAGMLSSARVKELEEIYDQNLTELDRLLYTTHIRDSLFVDSEATFRILTYTEKRNGAGFRNVSDSVTYVASVLKINGVEKEVPLGTLLNQNKKKSYTGGFVDKTTSKTIKIQVVNRDSTKQTYAEGEVTFKLPNTIKKDSVYTFTYRLRPTQYMYGIVYDSTMFVAGVHKDDDKTVNRPGEPLKVVSGATVSVTHGVSTTTDNKGFFKLLVPVGQELSMEVTKKGYAKATASISNWNPDSYQPSDDKTRQQFFAIQMDTVNTPDFKTLLGFDIKLNKKIINSGTGGVKTYRISGTLSLTSGKAKNDNIYKADKTQELTFKDVVVKSQNENDAKLKSNAVPLLSSVNFVETEAEIKLFGYAPVTLQGNHAGEPYIRLQYLLGKDGQGKIGASEMEFTQTTMMGIKFGKMKLSLKQPEKEKSFGKFDDKVSKAKAKDKDFKAQTDLEKEKAEKKDAEKTAKADAKKEAVENAKESLASAQEVQKNIAKTGTADDKKAVAKAVSDREKALADAQYAADGPTKIPEKEPLLLAFATENLEELNDSKEFSIEFEKQPNKDNEDYIKFTLGSVNLSSLGLGTVKTSAPMVSVIKVNVEKSSAVLKKSGVSMKGNIQFPQIWMFKTDKPLLIDKLDIDKQFGLKQVTFMKGDKGDIYQFGMADKWMFYITSFQIYNNFKGYGIGGTFNTDKDNYLNVKSLGLTVSDGKVYPNVALETAKDGFRFSSVRFKTIGKKSISFKGVQGKTPAQDGYEIEAALRMEYDDSEPKSTAATDSTNKFGRRLSDVETAQNRANTANKSFEQEQAALTVRKEAQKKVEEEVKKIEEEVDKQRVALSQEEDVLGKEEQSLTVRRINLAKSPRQTDGERAEYSEREAKIQADLAEFKRKREDLDARWAKWSDFKTAKDEEIEKIKKGEATKPAEAVAAAESDKKEDKGKDKEAPKEGLNWKDRLFPLNLHLFQWSTSGKLVVSAAPSERAFEFGPVNFKIRRIVYIKASSKDDQVKLSTINDLLKLNEDEVTKLNSTTNFNDANMTLSDGKRVGVFDKDEQKQRGAITSSGLSVKALSDKVASEDPKTAWAMGFSGGLELTSSTKGLTFDSDVTMIVGDFGKGTQFIINEIMLKLDGTGFRALGKVKLGTSGTKVGFEGAVDLETAQRKFAASFKYYKINDPEKKKYGIELGAAIQISSSIPMGSITWTSVGGGFDYNSVDEKYKVFFLGSAINTATPEKVIAYKNVNVTVLFDAKACGAAPVIKGSMDLWTNDEEFCKTSVELDFCNLRIIAKASCQKELAKTMVELNALVVISKAGFFAGAMARAEILGMNANGIIAIGILCNTSSPDMPAELSDYKQKLPSYLYQSDNVTFSGIYIGFELNYEHKSEGTFSIWVVKVASYSLDVKIKGNASLGVNFANGNFMIKAGVDMNLVGQGKVAEFTLGGMLRLGLKIEGGYLNDIGWNFLAQTYGSLQIYTNQGQYMACNDWRTYEYETQWGCLRRRWLRCVEYGWVQARKYPIPTTFDCKACFDWNLGVKYRQRGPESGWGFVK